jgi:pimeloyl-ACP methyl ester carboxylesterase
MSWRSTSRLPRTGDGVHIAYQVTGDGPFDLVFVTGLFSQVEHHWEEPGFARFLHRLASFARLIAIDARGAGLSDRAPELPPMEEQMDDVLAVLDAVGSSSVAFFDSRAGAMAILCPPLSSQQRKRRRSLRDPPPCGGEISSRSDEFMADTPPSTQVGSGLFLSCASPGPDADRPPRQQRLERPAGPRTP